MVQDLRCSHCSGPIMPPGLGKQQSGAWLWMFWMRILSVSSGAVRWCLNKSLCIHHSDYTVLLPKILQFWSLTFCIFHMKYGYSIYYKGTKYMYYTTNLNILHYVLICGQVCQRKCKLKGLITRIFSWCVIILDIALLLTRSHKYWSYANTHKQPSSELNQFPIWYWLQDILQYTDRPIS